MKQLIAGFCALLCIAVTSAAEDEMTQPIPAERSGEGVVTERADTRVAIINRAGIKAGDGAKAGSTMAPANNLEAPVILELTPALETRLTRPATQTVSTANEVSNELPAPVKRTIQLDPPAVKIVNRTQKFVFRVVKD